MVESAEDETVRLLVLFAMAKINLSCTENRQNLGFGFLA